MKCVCGYEYEYEYNYDKHELKVTKGDEDFIQIITIREFVTDKNVGDEDDYSNNLLKGGLYICPKCGTVRFEGNYEL